MTKEPRSAFTLEEARSYGLPDYYTRLELMEKTHSNG